MIRTIPSNSAPTKLAYQVSYKKTGLDAIKMVIPYSDSNIQNIRTIPDIKRHMGSDYEFWSCPLTIESITKLVSWGFVLDPQLTDKFKLSQQAKSGPEYLPTLDIPGLKGILRPFQEKGVSFIEARNGRALIADEMGLGKTVQALAYLQLHREIKPVIIVCPATLKRNWKREARKWLPDISVQIISGKKKKKGKSIRVMKNFFTGDLIIINYDILNVWAGTLANLNPQLMILDEAHYIKNDKAQRTRGTKKLSKNVPKIIGLSGTPIENRPIELFNIIHLIEPTLFPYQYEYAERYCGAKRGPYGWDFTGATNTKELHTKLINSIMIRRKKDDVLTELPPKVYSYVPISMSNRGEYAKAENDFISFVKRTQGAKAAEKAEKAEALVKIAGLKKLATEGKLKESIAWIKDFLESDQKLVVFAVHKFVIKAIMEAFPGISVKIVGGMSDNNKDKSVQQFQNNPKIRLFVGNIKAAGVGITLTAASNVAILELPWTPGALNQAIDRVHRIGQLDSVTAYYLLAEGTIEEKIAKLLDKKMRVLDAVLDGKKTKPGTLILEIMQIYKNKKAA